MPPNSNAVKVFISSTITDLKPERETVKQAMEELYLSPSIAEGWGARPETPREVCLREAGEADIYIGLFWQRYGFITDKGIAATEEEYQAARAAGKPILIYVKEPAQREVLLTRFLRDLQDFSQGHLYSSFDTLDELRRQVKRDVMRLVQQMAKQTSSQPAPKTPASGSIQVTVTNSAGAQVTTSGRDAQVGTASGVAPGQARSYTSLTRLRSNLGVTDEGSAVLVAEEQTSLLRQLETYRRRLTILEQQLAPFGLTAPVDKLLDKQYTEEQIVRLERRLDALGADRS